MKNIILIQSFDASDLFPKRLAFFGPGGGESGGKFDKGPQQPAPGSEQAKEGVQNPVDLSKQALKVGAAKVSDGMSKLERAAKAGASEFLDLVQSLPTIE